MAISIGDAMLKLGVDTKPLDQSMKSLGAKIKQHQKAIGIGMVAAGGAILAGATMAIKSYASMGDEVHKMALRTGFATETLSRLKYAAGLGGAALSDIEKAVKRMSATLYDAKQGLTTATDAMAELNLSLFDFRDTNPEEEFMIFATALANVEDASERSALAQRIFGRAGTQLLPMLSQGTEGLKLMMAEAEKFAPIFDQEAAEAAAKLTDTMGQLGGSMDKVKLAIASKLVPIIIPLLENFRDAVSQVSAWVKEHPKLTKVIVIGTTALGFLLVAFGSLLLIIPPLMAGLSALGISFTLSLGPIGLVIALIAVLVAMTVLVIKNWDTLATSLSQVWNWLVDAAQAAFVFISNLVQTYLIDPVMRVIAWWKQLLGILRGLSGTGGGGGEGGGPYPTPDPVMTGFEQPRMYARGGVIPEPTLLYGLRSRRPYGIAGEAGKEVITPAEREPIHLHVNLVDGRELAEIVIGPLGDMTLQRSEMEGT